MTAVWDRLSALMILLPGCRVATSTTALADLLFPNRQQVVSSADWWLWEQCFLACAVGNGFDSVLLAASCWRPELSAPSSSKKPACFLGWFFYLRVWCSIKKRASPDDALERCD